MRWWSCRVRCRLFPVFDITSCLESQQELNRASVSGTIDLSVAVDPMTAGLPWSYVLVFGPASWGLVDLFQIQVLFTAQGILIALSRSLIYDLSEPPFGRYPLSSGEAQAVISFDLDQALIIAFTSPRPPILWLACFRSFTLLMAVRCVAALSRHASGIPSLRLPRLRALGDSF